MDGATALHVTPKEASEVAESGQTLQGSFSAVSKLNLASKYSLESSRRDLHNALLCTVLESICENRGKRSLAKTTPKRKKTRKREANKQRAASHLELQRKGAAEKHRENKE